MGGNSINSVFYANRYHPIQAGSIDGTDVLPHDNGVYRAHLCSSASLYNPFGDPKVTGDPYCTLFVGRLNHLTNEDTLLKVMSKYGRVKNLRLVRHIVTGASRGYAFVVFESDKEMRRAYEDAHHSFIDDHEIIVDYNRQQLMPGWIPRRLGGGLGGKKESGQLRFGGRERPFRAPLRPIPFDDLKRLGISPPPEGRYMSCFQVPPPPRRKTGGSIDRKERGRTSSVDREESIHKRSSMGREEPFNERRSVDKDGRYYKRPSTDREEQIHKRSSIEKGENTRKRRSEDRVERSRDRGSTDRSEHNGKKRSRDSEERSHKHHRHSSHSHRQERKWSSSGDHY